MGNRITRQKSAFLFPKSRMRKAGFELGFAVILRAPFDRAASTKNRPNPINNDRDMAELQQNMRGYSKVAAKNRARILFLSAALE